MTPPFTPGPWIAAKGAGWIVTRPDAAAKREAAIMVGMHSDASLVCTPTWPEDAVEAEANARLIAAAPDLYEALIALMAEIESYSDAPGRDEYGSMGDARAALAKACPTPATTAEDQS